MAHILEGRPKLTTKEADGEKAFKQVIESTLQEKDLELAHMEQRAIVAERAWDSTEQKFRVLEG